MCGFQDTLSNIMPVDWLDPYGRTPFAKDAELSVDITIVETEDGIKASSVKNPPSSGSNRLMNAIKQALGVDLINCGAENGLQQSADLGKQNDMKNYDKKESSDKMESTSPEGPNKQGSQSSTPGTTPDEPDEKEQEKDAKEKAPKF